jgi:single-strand DNA-binding protein
MEVQKAASSAASSAVEMQHRNEVLIRGRMAATAKARELPSGDGVVTFRVIIEREPQDAGGRRRVDTIDCSAWAPPVQSSVLAWEAGALVEVTGALRRRFRRGEGGTTSRVQVEVGDARRVP